MRILKNFINKSDASGGVTLVAEDGEDLWHVYNLIHAGDRVRAGAIRKVVREGEQHEPRRAVS
jgi:protein pelota